MNKGKQVRCRLPMFSKVDYFMFISQSCQTRIASPGIRHNSTARLNRCCDKCLQAGRRCVWNLFHAYSPNSRSILLSGNDNQCLIFDLSASQTLFETAEIGFVNFYRATQSISAWSDHSPAQFMKPRPSSFITAQPKNPFQPQCACTILLAGDPPDCPEPKGQGHPASLKNSPAGNRCLVTACSALNKIDANWPPLATIASRTAKPVRPAHLQQITTASFFSRKSRFKFNKGFGVIFHTPAYYILG